MKELDEKINELLLDVNTAEFNKNNQVLYKYITRKERRYHQKHDLCNLSNMFASPLKG